MRASAQRNLPIYRFPQECEFAVGNGGRSSHSLAAAFSPPCLPSQQERTITLFSSIPQRTFCHLHTLPPGLAAFAGTPFPSFMIIAKQKKLYNRFFYFGRRRQFLIIRSLHKFLVTDYEVVLGLGLYLVGLSAGDRSWGPPKLSQTCNLLTRVPPAASGLDRQHQRGAYKRRRLRIQHGQQFDWYDVVAFENPARGGG